MVSIPSLCSFVLNRLGNLTMPRKQLLVAAAIIILKDREKKRKRRMWVRTWLTQRESLGAFNNLIGELRLQDATGFQNFCLLSVSNLEQLLSFIGPRIEKKNTRLRAAISAKERLLVTLRFLATGETYRSLMHQFRISDSAISKIVPEVCEAIADLTNHFIKLPASANDWKKVAEDFYNNWNFPHCVGALDGKHVVMQAPPDSGSYYYNYKHTHSIMLMALVDANCRILYIDIGANGKCSDGGIFENCTLYHKLTSKTLDLPNPTPLSGRLKNSPYVIVADEAFTSSEFLMKPYPALNQPEPNKVFNYRLSRVQRLVENVFGHMAQRFRVLRRPLLVGPAVTEQLVTAVCVLHNFLSEANGDYAPPQCYDREDPITHNLIEGEWRTETLEGTYFSLQQIENDRNSLQNKQVREEFKQFFMSTRGEVPWQYKYI